MRERRAGVSRRLLMSLRWERPESRDCPPGSSRQSRPYLKGKTVAVRGLGSPPHLFLASMFAYVGLNPRADITWVTLPSGEAKVGRSPNGYRRNGWRSLASF